MTTNLSGATKFVLFLFRTISEVKNENCHGVCLDIDADSRVV